MKLIFNEKKFFLHDVGVFEGRFIYLNNDILCSWLTNVVDFVLVVSFELHNLLLYCCMIKHSLYGNGFIWL